MIIRIFHPVLQKEGIVWKIRKAAIGKNTNEHSEFVFYYLPENDRREFVGKWEPYVPYYIS